MKSKDVYKRRVVVTGIGVITPIGNNIESYCEGLKKSKCGIDKISTFDVEKWKYKHAAEIKHFEPYLFFSKKELRRMDKASQISLVAAEEAITNSKIDFSVVNRYKVGVCLGTTLGGTLLAQKYYKKLLHTSKHYVSLNLDYPLYSVGTRISVKYKLFGPNIVVSTACSSSNVAMSCAYNMIRLGQTDIMITGGFDTVTELTCAGFGVLRNVAKEVCRPFDKNRDGLILGEAAGILLFEELQHAKERKAHIFAEILGFGLSSDAYHLTAPDVSGNGPAKAIKMAIENSELDVSQIDYVNAHGTGTQYNDLVETRAIKKVFKDHAYKIPVSSTKSMIGHTLGACGAVELIATILAINNNFVPPTINYSTPDPECDLDYVPNFAREKEIKIALSNTFGFGGNNCSIVVSKYTGDDMYGEN